MPHSPLPPAIPPAGRLVRLGVVLPADLAAARRLALICDRAGVDVLWARDAATVDVVRPFVALAIVSLLPARDEPWARTVPVSIGRTATEATARARLDPAFDASGGIVGALDDGQARVAELAHAGVTDIRCVLPDVPDVADLVAQITALAVGTPETHRPGAPPSPAPPPPPWAAPRG